MAKRSGLAVSNVVAAVLGTMVLAGGGMAVYNTYGGGACAGGASSHAKAGCCPLMSDDTGTVAAADPSCCSGLAKTDCCQSNPDLTCTEAVEAAEKKAQAAAEGIPAPSHGG